MAEHSKNYDKVKRYYNMGMWERNPCVVTR